MLPLLVMCSLCLADPGCATALSHHVCLFTCHCRFISIHVHQCHCHCSCVCMHLYVISIPAIHAPPCISCGPLASILPVHLPLAVHLLPMPLAALHVACASCMYHAFLACACPFVPGFMLQASFHDIPLVASCVRSNNMQAVLDHPLCGWGPFRGEWPHTTSIP